MKITKDNIVFNHHDGLWCCSMIKEVRVKNKYDRGMSYEKLNISWGWGESIKTSFNMAKDNLRLRYKG